MVNLNRIYKQMADNHPGCLPVELDNNIPECTTFLRGMGFRKLPLKYP